MGMRWVRSHRGHLTCIDWSPWLAGTKPVDPYMVWADLSKAASFYHADTSPVAKWPLIVELAQPALRAPAPDSIGECPDPARAAAEVPWVFGCIEISPAYLVEKVENGTKRYYIDGAYLTTRMQPAMIEMLLHSEHIRRFQLGLPRLATPVPKPRILAGNERRAAGGQVARVVVGIVDDGCAFAHPALADADGGTRVRYLWDQDRRRTADHSWKQLEDFGYGAELDPQSLREATLLAAHTDDELAPYRRLQYGHWRLDADTHASRPFDADGRLLPVGSQLSASHGAAVTQLAVGNPPPLRAQATGDDTAVRPPPTRWDQDRRRRIAADIARLSALPDAQRRMADLAAVDAATQWDLVFVQLPSQTVADTSGGSLAVQVLDGVRYIQWRARRLPYEGATPAEADDYVDNAVVVNISYGALGGGHDGTSILEGALRERTQTQPPSSTFVVVAAGNGHRNGSHADFELVPDVTASLIFTVGPDNPRESYLEIWLPDVDVHAGDIGETASARLLVTVTTPSGARLPVARQGQSWQFQNGEHAAPGAAAHEGPVPEAALIWSRRVVQSQRGTMLLLAVGRTRRGVGGPDAVSGEHGDWEIELTLTGPWTGESAGLRVHAWCERNDLVYGQRRGQQARVSFDPPPNDPSECHPEAIRFLREGHRTSPDQRPPHGFRTSSSLSSLAGVAPAPVAEALRPTRQGDGRYVIVGGYRMHDGEMSAISSGGPGRSYSRVDYWNALQGRPLVTTDLRMSPDVDAPSDLGPAVAGLRVPALMPASQQRVSGTSAAAALATRTVANLQYWRLVHRAFPLDGMRATVDATEVLMTLPATGPGADRCSRPTLTPQTDDVFRRGHRRIR